MADRDEPEEVAALATVPVSPALAPALAGLEPVPELAAGTLIHRYVIERVLGAGAMGTVYAAHDRELHRRVAIKVLRHARGSHGQRLLQEAKALARLSHSNVVTVYDAGSHGAVLFLVMELVDGQNLRSWLVERPRSWREVLEVFRPAGEGLAAAHAVGIIHRDFKPDNVLIDRGGRVRVGDFGVARLSELDVEPDGDETSGGGSGLESTVRRAPGLTASGTVLGSPAYMAPEQWDPSGRLDGRTDQFAFCVALYEALYGHRPFAGDSVTQLASNVERGELEPAPRDRGEPAWLRRAVERGLSRDPSDRHPDMRALLAALSRDPRRRRRRWIAAAAGVGLVGSVAAALVLTPRGGAPDARCQGAPERLATAWTPSVRDAIGAAFRATGSPLAADTSTRVGRALDERARDWIALRTASCEATRRGEQEEEALDLVVECLDRRLADMRALTGAMAERADTAMVIRAVQAVDALPSARGCADAVALSAAVPPPDETQRVAVAALRARLAVPNALYLTGRYADALEPARVVTAEARALGYRPLEAEALLLLGRIQRRVAELGPAEATLGEAIAAANAGRAAALELESWLELVSLISRDQQRFDEARKLGEVARAVLDRVPDRERAAAEFDSWKASFLIEEDVDRAAALPYIERALAAYERLDGPDSLAMVEPMRHLAGLSWFQEDYDKALRIFRMARAIAEKKLGPEHPISIAKIAGEGAALNELGRNEEALATHRRGLELATRVHGADSPQAGMYVNNIGLLLRELGQHREALSYLERSLATRERVFGPDHIEVALGYANLSTALRPLGRAREALPLLQRALTIAEAQGPPGHINVAGILMNLGETYLDLGDPKRARQAAERALAILDRAKMKEWFLTGWGSFILARALDRMGERARADGSARRALRILEKIGDKDVGPDVRVWLARRKRGRRAGK